MFESRFAFDPTPLAMSSPTLQSNYDELWDGVPKKFEA